MKFFTRFSFSFLVLLFAFFAATKLSAQCNVNEKYDKLISGYHSTIALKSNGTYAVWGSGMTSNGSTDALAPQDIILGNYPTLTGNVVKAALGGNTSNTKVDQAILLTTTGLFAWGIEGAVISNALTTSTTFQKITSPSGANTYGLPTGVNPGDVTSLFATYQTLVILTATGNVWILTQTTAAVEANGGTATTAGSSVWKQVKINGSTNLTNVTAVRGQVSSGTYNAFMALTSAGEVYTWGNSSYLGNAAGSSARVFATLMTIPAEFSSSIPKLIGVTGGIATTGTTKNTYYLLSNAGNLYTLGDNTQRQCGDFTIAEKTSWVNAKINSTTNFSNISFFSCQEHNASYPGVVAITTSGDLYTWGNNNSSMLGRTSNGTAGGTVGPTYDPGMPVGFTSGTDKAVSAELGGHTLVYLKEGNSQFCYVGHRTNGSVGDGTTTSSTNGGFFASCAITPVIDICGSVPVAASAVNSTITASPSTIVANGSSTSTLTIQLKNASNVNLIASGGTVIVSTTSGVTGTVTDNNNGTYTVVLTSSITPTSAVVTYTINGTAAANSATVVFSSMLPLTWGNVLAYRKNNNVQIEWTTEQELNASYFDVERSFDAVTWSAIITKVPAKNTGAPAHYVQTDKDDNAGRLFYRIKQYDIDAHYTYSIIRMVLPFEGSGRILVYPIPVISSFQIGNVIPDHVKQIDLYTVSGIKIKSWKIFQPSFDVQGIGTGIYILRVQMLDGSEQKIKLNKL